MKTIFFFIIGLGICFCSRSQPKLKLAELKTHVGDSIVVEGKVNSVQYLPAEAKSPTYINVGNVASENLLTVVIWGEQRRQYTVRPEDAYQNKKIRISGILTQNNGKYEIIILNPSQIVVIDKK